MRSRSVVVVWSLTNCASAWTMCRTCSKRRDPGERLAGDAGQSMGKGSVGEFSVSRLCTVAGPGGDIPASASWRLCAAGQGGPVVHLIRMLRCSATYQAWVLRWQASCW
jgi:hypothetical protein